MTKEQSEEEIRKTIDLNLRFMEARPENAHLVWSVRALIAFMDAKAERAYDAGINEGMGRTKGLGHKRREYVQWNESQRSGDDPDL